MIRNEDLTEDLMRAFSGSASKSAAKKCYRKGFLDDLKYVSYFTLNAAYDEELSLRVVFIGRSGAPKAELSYKGDSALKILEDYEFALKFGGADEGIEAILCKIYAIA